MTGMFRRLQGRRRRGTAIVEMAVVAPFLMLLLLGIIEIGYVLFIRSQLIEGAHQGARIGIVREGADAEDMIKGVLNNLESLGDLVTRDDIEASIVVDPATGTTVRVKVSVPYERIAIFGKFLSPEFDVGSESVMYK